MSKIRKAVLCGLLAMNAAVLRADKLVTQLRVSVDTFSIRRIDARTPTRVVFTGSPMRADVSLVAAALPSPSNESLSVALPSKDWWSSLVWEVEGPDGKTTRLHPQLNGKASPSPELKSGERLVAHFKLDELPLGAYRLRVRMGDMQSAPEWFLVSNGQENDDLRREFARYNVDRSADRESLRRNLLALAAADPTNASPWIRLGDLALTDGSQAQILDYYDHAMRVLEQRRQTFSAQNRADVVEAIEGERRLIAEVSDAVPQYVANRGTLILHADLEGGKHYVLRERATGRVVRTIGGGVHRE